MIRRLVYAVAIIALTVVSLVLLDRDAALDVLLLACLIPAVLAPAAYHLLAPWWRSPMGRHVMSYMAVVAGVFLLIGISRWWPEMPGRQSIRVVMYACLAWALWYRLDTVISTQIHPERYRTHIKETHRDQH